MTTDAEASIGRPEATISYVRVSILGSGPSGEVWSINPVFDPTGEFGTIVDQGKLDAAALAIANRTISANLLALMSTSFSRTGARVEVRDDATDALLGISVQGSSSAAVGTGAARMPLQAATVISVRTNTPGGSGRGRLYWPAAGGTISTAGRLTTPSTAQVCSEFRAYLLGMSNDLATAFSPIAFNLAVRSKTTKTTPHAVRIQVGDVIDTQRRRRDALAEAYTQLSYPT